MFRTNLTEMHLHRLSVRSIMFSICSCHRKEALRALHTDFRAVQKSDTRASIILAAAIICCWFATCSWCFHAMLITLPARVRINTSRGSFHHMSIKSAEKHSKSLIYRAKQTKKREQCNLLSFFNLRYLYSSISII